MAGKQHQLRTAWSGDVYEVEGVHIDSEGSWDDQHKAVKYTDAQALQLIERAGADGVVLVLVQDPAEQSTTAESTNTKE